MHPRVEIGCAEAPQFPYPHSAYLALADETLKCFRVDLQQGCRLARIEEPLEMRDRLADWRYFVHLAHKTPTARVETGLKSRHRLKAGCGVWLRSTDFEPIHYSAGISLRVMGGREQIRKKTAQDAFVASFQRILFFVDFETTSQEVLKVPKAPKAPRSAFKVRLGNPREQIDR